MKDRERSGEVSRRAAIGGAMALAITAESRRAEAAATKPPVVYLSHGSPRLPLDRVRSREIARWGARLPKPRGIVVMTPHFGSRKLAIGSTARGFGMYNMPGWMKSQLPANLDYPSPPSTALAARVNALIGEGAPLDEPPRPGFDHTTWMPLYYLYRPADAPVLEIAYPYRSDGDLFLLGRKLAPLREEGVLFVASGQLTHNLASMNLRNDVKTPSWSREFDHWSASTLGDLDVDALLDWRNKAPAAELAHPDDGGHFRVLLVALGMAIASKGAPAGGVEFPVTGFESTMSKRCVQFS